MNTALIRPAEPADIPQLVNLGKNLFNEHLLYDGDYYILEKNFEDYFKPWLYQLISDKYQFIYIAATTDGKIVGFVSGFIKNLFSWFVTKKVGHISFLIIENTFRRKKIGQQLETAACNWFRKEGITYIETYVDEKNFVGRQAWTYYGYSPFKKFIRKKLTVGF